MDASSLGSLLGSALAVLGTALIVGTHVARARALRRRRHHGLHLIIGGGHGTRPQQRSPRQRAAAVLAARVQRAAELAAHDPVPIVQWQPPREDPEPSPAA